MIIDKLTPEFASEQMSTFVFHLVNDRFSLPDSLRDYKKLVATVKRVMDEPNSTLMSVVNNAGELGAVFGIINVVPGHDARFVLWVWDKKVMTAGLVKSMKDYITAVANIAGLRRVTAQTPCDNACRILDMAGFKLEGKFRHGFQYQGKTKTLYQYRKVEA